MYYNKKGFSPKQKPQSPSLTINHEISNIYAKSDKESHKKLTREEEYFFIDIFTICKKILQIWKNFNFREMLRTGVYQHADFPPCGTNKKNQCICHHREAFSLWSRE